MVPRRGGDKGGKVHLATLRGLGVEIVLVREMMGRERGWFAFFLADLACCGFCGGFCFAIFLGLWVLLWVL